MATNTKYLRRILTELKTEILSVTYKELEILLKIGDPVSLPLSRTVARSALKMVQNDPGIYHTFNGIEFCRVRDIPKPLIQDSI